MNLEQQIRNTLLMARRWKRLAKKVEDYEVVKRLASVVICLEDALDKLRGGE